MSEYVAPGMQAEFVKNNEPQASEPSGLPVICMGRVIQIEEGLYLDEYATVSGVGTDISGAGSSDWMDSDVGNGTATGKEAPYLTGGSSAESVFGTWAAVADGSFRVDVDGTFYNVDAIGFAGDVSMTDVADTIQAALRAETGALETVAWDTDHFVITSTTDIITSTISVLETSTGVVGTDISGAGAADWMDADLGQGVETAVVAAKLTGGSNAESAFASWAAISRGSFDITIDGESYALTQVDFSGVTSMSGVAAVLQAAIRAETSSTETASWSTDHFIINSVDLSALSEVSVPSAASGTIGVEIPGIMAGATLISDDEIVVAVQLDANASIITVPTDSWTRTGTNMVIDADLFNELLDHLSTLDGTLVESTRLLLSPTTDFDEIGVVQGYSVATLEDGDGLAYPAVGVYDVSLASGTDAGKLYFTGTAKLPTTKITLADSTNFDVGDVVSQAVTLATGTIVQIDAPNDVIILGSVTGTFTVSANAVTSVPGGGNSTATGVADVGLLGFKVALKMDGAARIDYKALRTDLCGTKTKVTTSTLLALAGNEESIVPENQAIWAAKIVTDVGEYCYLVGVDDVNGWVHEHNATASKWNDEFAILKLQSQADCAYQYLICSENAEVHAYTDLFLAWMRLPEKSKLAIGWTSFKSETMDYVLHDTEVPVGHAGGGAGTFTADENLEILGLLPGGYVLFHNPADSDDDEDIRVLSVSGGEVTLDGVEPTGITTSWTFEVINSVYTLDEIANAAKVYAEGYSTSALRFAWNERLDMVYNGVTYTDVPRYFWYAYRAAILSAALDLSQTFTREEVTYLFKTSTIPFLKGDDDRLNVVASGGVDIIMQDADGRPLYSRHALTTDMTDELTQNQSIMHQFDYVALVMFETYRDYIGKDKITNRTLAMYKNMFTGIKMILSRRQCLEYLQLISLAVDPTNKAKLIWEVEGEAVYPFLNALFRIFMN